MPNDVPEEATDRAGRVRWRDIGFFLRFVRPVWPLGAASLLTGVIAAGLTALLPFSTKVIIDFVLMDKEPERLLRILATVGPDDATSVFRKGLHSVEVVLLSVLAISLVGGVLRLAQRVLTVRFQQGLTLYLQTSLIDHVLRFPLSFFRRRLSGYIVSRIMGDVHAVQSLFSQRIEHLLTSLFRVSVGIGMVYFLSPSLTLIALCVLPVYVVINGAFAQRVRGAWRQVMERQAQVSEHLQETIAGVEVVKAYGGEQRALDGASGRLRAVMHARFRGVLLGFLSSNLVGAVQLGMTLVITWFGVREVRAGHMSIGDFAAFNSYLVFLIVPVRALATFHMGLQPAFASLDRLIELFRTVPEDDHHAERRGDHGRARGGVAFRNVAYRYDDGPLVLQDVSLDAAAGEVIALVGPSGAGKTTLVSLMLAFDRPEQGQVLLNGRDLRSLSVRWLRQQVGYVSQECFLFADSVRNNIRYGRPASSDEDVCEAALRACVHDEIEALPQGYDTVLGERGVGLSVGQKQRISIARCFLKDPPIVIFDEPSAALDARSESLLKDSFRRLMGHRTTFIIAHRLSTIDMADRIVVMDQGRIVEHGSHASLMRSCGLYKDLFERQHGAA